MNAENLHAAMATWAARNLPGRLHSEEVAMLLNCSVEDVAILVGSGKLKALGRPKPNGVKYFSAIEVILLLADRSWLDEITKTITAHWRRKNERRAKNQGRDVLNLTPTPVDVLSKN